jgi:hypothetical protein
MWIPTTYPDSMFMSLWIIINTDALFSYIAISYSKHNLSPLSLWFHCIRYYWRQCTSLAVSICAWVRELMNLCTLIIFISMWSWHCDNNIVHWWCLELIPRPYPQRRKRVWYTSICIWGLLSQTWHFWILITPIRFTPCGLHEFSCFH